jgi:hypothetical protein
LPQVEERLVKILGASAEDRHILPDCPRVGQKLVFFEWLEQADKAIERSTKSGRGRRWRRARTVVGNAGHRCEAYLLRPGRDATRLAQLRSTNGCGG